MKFDKVILHRIRLPLIKPYRSSFKTFTEFEPIIVEVHDTEGHIGWGESNIPPGSSFETVESGWKFCSEYAEKLIGKPVADAKVVLANAIPTGPNAATAMLTAIAMLERHPVLQLSEETRVPLATAVGAQQTEEIEKEVDRHIANGYRTLKVKVGWNVDQDLARVESIRTATARRAELTLDANRAYSCSDGCRFAQSLDPDGIKLFEQPCGADDWEANAAVASVSKVPLMLDESIRSIADIERTAMIPGVKFVKMKLKRMGGIDQTLVASERAWQLGLSVCLGDGVATEIGCWMEACIARLAISTAGEMNGFLKPKVRLFVDPLPYEAAAIVLKPGFWPVIDRKVLAAHAIATEKFAAVRVA